MSIRVISIQDGYVLVQSSATGGRYFHIPEDEVGQLLEDLLSAAVTSQIEGAPFDPQVSRVCDLIDVPREEDEL